MRSGPRFDDWWASGQRAALEQSLPAPVFAAACTIARDLARRGELFMVLHDESITLAWQRAISSERVRRFGALPSTNDAWQRQRDIVEASGVDFNAPPSAALMQSDPPDRAPDDGAKSLAELARAWRASRGYGSPRPSPPQEDIAL